LTCGAAILVSRRGIEALLSFLVDEGADPIAAGGVIEESLSLLSVPKPLAPLIQPNIPNELRRL
jgi:hypothetical protein